MTPTGSTASDTALLLAWAETHPGRVYRSALHIAVGLLRPDEPRTVGYLLANAEDIVNRHATAVTSTKQTYTSRVRSACLEFTGGSMESRRVRRFGPGQTIQYDSGLSVEQEISEALLAMSRWRHLRTYMLPGLMAAMKELNKPQVRIA